MTNSLRTTRRVLATALAVVALSAVEARAQSANVDPHWRAWIGCWRPVDQAASAVPLPKICVLPGDSPSRVDVATIDSGKVVSRYTVDASGVQRPVSREGCTGFERATWSSDSLRVFLRSELSCGSGLGRASTGIMSITAAGDWVDVQTVKVAENEAVRAVRYTDAGSSIDLPTEVTASVAGSRRLDRRTSLLAAGSRLTNTAIIEAARQLDTSTVQAWLVERGESFSVDARTLVALADAGVPGSVTDVMVAIANPTEFRFSRDAGEGPLNASDSARIASMYLGRRGLDCGGASRYSPFGWGMDPCYDFAYSRYGSRYGYGYGPSYGYGYGNGYGGAYDGYYGYYTRPVVIVRGDDTQKGVAVKGQGYTRASRGSGGDEASSRSERPASSSSGSSSSGGSSSTTGSSSGSTGSSSSGSGRTAKTRPPGEK